MEKSEELKARTKKLAVRIFHLVSALPKNDQGKIVGRQILRSGTSVAANYRAVCRARSKAEFIAKLGVVVEEADETVFWLEFISECGLFNAVKLQPLQKEAGELFAIFIKSQMTAKDVRSS